LRYKILSRTEHGKTGRYTRKNTREGRGTGREQTRQTILRWFIPAVFEGTRKDWKIRKEEY
jgi:hypothetical protein